MRSGKTSAGQTLYWAENLAMTPPFRGPSRTTSARAHIAAMAMLQDRRDEAKQQLEVLALWAPSEEYRGYEFCHDCNRYCGYVHDPS
jgi:hypothetical protein